MKTQSFTHQLLASEFDIASAQFAMNWAIEDGDFEEAMSLHFEYLYHRDEQTKLWLSMTHAEMDTYLRVIAAIEGWKYEH
jgi:hypothetical protein